MTITQPGSGPVDASSRENAQGGFVLLESLVALAMVSILSISAMTLVQTVSKVYVKTSSDEVTRVTVELINDPQYHKTNGRLRLDTVRNLEDGGTWRLYRLRTRTGNRVTIPIYVSPEER